MSNLNLKQLTENGLPWQIGTPEEYEDVFYVVKEDGYDNYHIGHYQCSDERMHVFIDGEKKTFHLFDRVIKWLPTHIILEKLGINNRAYSVSIIEPTKNTETETEDELRAQRDRAIEMVRGTVKCEDIHCWHISDCKDCPHVFGEPAKTEDTPVSQSERVVALATISREDLLKMVDILQTQRDNAIEFFNDGCLSDCAPEDECRVCPYIFGTKEHK
jgi:hypothetical protein